MANKIFSKRDFPFPKESPQMENLIGVSTTDEKTDGVFWNVLPMEEHLKRIGDASNFMNVSFPYECTEAFRELAEEQRQKEENHNIIIDPLSNLEKTVLKLVAPNSFEEPEILRKIQQFVVPILGPRPRNGFIQWDKSCSAILAIDWNKEAACLKQYKAEQRESSYYF